MISFLQLRYINTICNELTDNCKKLTFFFQAFAIDRSKNTITTKDASKQSVIGQRKVDSHLRIFNLFIGCIPAVSNDNNGVGLLFSSKGIGIAWIIFPTAP